MSDMVDGRYRIERKLAVGGFGTIYRATDLQLGRDVALKILHPELAGDASAVARFHREGAALARLRSPHTLTLYDVGETTGTLYFVMELLRGESLFDHFARTGPLPWRRLAQIARGVCASLREAHAHGIVHRDLKPANIFLEHHESAADFVKVLDFGIAKILESSELEHGDLTRVGQMIGTFDYMAPEQMVGAPCTSKSDIFALGIVLYEMLTGVRPFGPATATNPAQLLLSVMTEMPAPLTGVPPELASSVMQCLARDPIDRPDVEQLDAVLAHVLAADALDLGDLDEPTQVSPPPQRPGAWPPAITQVRGSGQASMMAGALAPSPSPSPSAAVVRDSRARIEHDIELALAETVTSEVNHAIGARFAADTGYAADAHVVADSMFAADAHVVADSMLAADAHVVADSMFAADARVVADSMLAAEAHVVADSMLAADAHVVGDSMFAADARHAADTYQAADAFLAEGSDVHVSPSRRMRMAAGTAPIERSRMMPNGASEIAGSEPAHGILARRVVEVPAATGSRALAFARFATIAACLFGLGFLGALVLWSL